MDIARILGELKRRRVFRVAAAYAVVGFAVAEGIDMVLPRLGAPEWVTTVFIVAILAGFPIVLVLAWALEVTPDGVRVTPPAGPGTAAPQSGAAGRAGYVAVFVLGAALSLGVGWLLGWGRTTAGDPVTAVRSLAVLPFAALSDESGDRWLAQGLHDQLITELAHLGGLDGVISRTSVLRYAQDPPPVPVIARELGVDAVIEGSILPSADRVRINVQLIHGATDDHLWARDYERSKAEALDLVKSVAQDVAREIRLQLSAGETARFAETRTVNPAAQEAYFRGRAAWNERTQEGMETAAEEFQRAIDLDPDYAQAYAGMAILHALGWGAGDANRVETYADRALELDPGNAEAYAALGFVFLYRDYEWERAEEAFRTAVRVQPGYATAYQWGAEMLAGLGRPDEAVEWTRRARELDPFSGIIAWNELRVLYLTGRFEECVAANERYERDFADYTRGGNRPQCLVGAGRYAEAAEALGASEEVRTTIAAEGAPAFWAWAAEHSVAGRLGVRTAAVQQGDFDPLFEMLDRIFEEWGGPGLNACMILADPLLRPAHEDPRWKTKVLERLGLDEWPS